MNTLAKDFKAAFGSVWALLGVIISAALVFNWLSGVLKIGLSALFAKLLGTFRSVFHPVVEFLTGWAIPWLPFLALSERKDGLVLRLAIGGATLRTVSNWFGGPRPPVGLVDSINDWAEVKAFGLQSQFQSVFIWFVTPIVWPVLLY